MTTAYELIRILLASDQDDAAIDSALAHLRTSPSVDVPNSTTSTAQLLDSYRRRAQRHPSDVLGLQRTVERLGQLSDKDVRLAVYASRGMVSTIVFSVGGDLVGCIVGPDRRITEDSA